MPYATSNGGDAIRNRIQQEDGSYRARGIEPTAGIADVSCRYRMLISSMAARHINREDARVANSSNSWILGPAYGFEGRGPALHRDPLTSAQVQSGAVAIRGRTPSSAAIRLLGCLLGCQRPRRVLLVPEGNGDNMGTNGHRAPTSHPTSLLRRSPPPLPDRSPVASREDACVAAWAISVWATLTRSGRVQLTHSFLVIRRGRAMVAAGRPVLVVRPPSHTPRHGGVQGCSSISRSARQPRALSALSKRYLRRVPPLGLLVACELPFNPSISSATFSISERTHSLARCRDSSESLFGSPAMSRAKRPLTVRRVPEPLGCRVSSI